MEMNEILDLALAKGASDIHIAVGRPVTFRLHGELVNANETIMKPEDTEALMKSITSEGNRQKIEEIGSADFGFAFGDSARFRVSAFKQKGNYGIVLRIISGTLLTFEQIGIPTRLTELLHKPRGLVLVTGPTGSGKSTTLATMIDYINEHRDAHIITVEDPIEFYHTHKRSIVTQREIGVDTPNFAEAIRRALRQDPDVILVGEMRDLETISAAISAAETGHLVFGTLHTTGAAKTVDRIIDVFPSHQQDQIRTQLSTSINAVISQTLIPRIDQKGRVAAFEIMISTPAIANLIRENKTFRITSDIQTGAKHGMKTLDTHLLELFSQGIIAYEEMIEKSHDPDQIAIQAAQLGGKVKKSAPSVQQAPRPQTPPPPKQQSTPNTDGSFGGMSPKKKGWLS